MEISAICRRDRISKQNEVAIIIRLYHNGIVRKITSGLRIKVDYWDFDNNCLKNGIPNQEHLQYLLDNFCILNMNLWKNENLNPKKHPQHLCRGKSQKFTTPRWNTSMKPNWKEWRRIYVSWWIIIWRIKRGKKYISVSDSWRIWSVLKIGSFFYIRIVIVLNSGILYLTTKNPPFPVYS